ncbi:hypothetical protein [Bacillus solimangrovi]|uniref:Uncharacterized protein n=1 Tax=Bacillus solimangrovi TaxID=1305675 RepID=A0A1E5LIZ2_9BACI|nr:hypothetical protein [Bacillus solimangrovi]OEH94006.1 hypothetical protein BFG57_10190 [Bacillus solimangrovi]
MKVLPLVLTVGILFSGIGIATSLVSRDDNQIDRDQAQVALREALASDPKVMIEVIMKQRDALRTPNSKSIDELLKNKNEEKLKYLEELKISNPEHYDFEIALIELQYNYDYSMIDGRTGIGFFHIEETNEYLNKLGTLEWDIRTGKISDALTGEELTSAIEISRRLSFQHPYKVVGDVYLFDQPEKLGKLLKEEYGKIEPNIETD